jgi:hypothetical protein
MEVGQAAARETGHAVAARAGNGSRSRRFTLRPCRDAVNRSFEPMPNAVIEEARHLFSGEQNLSFTERSLSVVGGLALAALAAKPRPNMWLSVAVLIAGSALAIRGATGHCSVKAMVTDGTARQA